MGLGRAGIVDLGVRDILGMQQEDIEKRNQQKSAQINFALGVFILFFGILVLVATFFTETPIGMKTNLSAGVVLCIIGGAMCFFAHRKKNR